MSVGGYQQEAGNFNIRIINLKEKIKRFLIDYQPLQTKLVVVSYTDILVINKILWNFKDENCS